MGKKRKARRTPVAKGVQALGGIVKAAAIAGTTPTTMYAWEDEGVRLFRPALRLARALGIPVDPRLEALAPPEED